MRGKLFRKPGLAPLLDAGYRPHVSLGVCNRIEPSAFEGELSSFAASVAPFPLSLSSVGIFPGVQGVIFLGVTVTEYRLLDVHAAFHKIFKTHAQEQSEYYAVGKWVPHCTLAFRFVRASDSRSSANLSECSFTHLSRSQRNWTDGGFTYQLPYTVFVQA